MYDQRLIEDCVLNAPLVLLALLEDTDIVGMVDEYLPYSTGFEIECNQLSGIFNKQNFLDIPDILDVNCDYGEQRFRIPAGIEGIICLYNISEQLKLNSELNYGSGIHYHVNMADCYDAICDTKNTPFIEANHEWILKQLDTWNYQGTYNKREYSWYRFNDLGTIEYRVGEMTFDYSLLIKRIIHCNKITKALRQAFDVVDLELNPKRTIDVEKIDNYFKGLNTSQQQVIYYTEEFERLKKELKEAKNKQEFKVQEEHRFMVQKRIKRI